MKTSQQPPSVSFIRRRDDTNSAVSHEKCFKYANIFTDVSELSKKKVKKEMSASKQICFYKTVFGSSITFAILLVTFEGEVL